MFRTSFHLCIIAVAVAYQPFKVPKTPVQVKAANAAATTALAVLLSASSPAWASTTAAQISLDQIPPTSISVQIGDLPVLGKALSGTYTKVPDGSFSGKPSIVIKSPEDKVKAVQNLATSGRLEFDINGKIKTHLDIDLAADEPGVARVRVASELIPKLPYKNLASSSSSPTGGRESAWNIVTNMGNGESYYYNVKSGVTQYERPDKF
jgi:hypothetical protein